MVTTQVYRHKDPNGLGRGAGYYYLRGGKRAGSFTLPSGVTVKGAYYSKYNKKLDRERKSTGWKVDRVGTPPKLTRRFAHVSDGHLMDRVRR